MPGTITRYVAAGSFLPLNCPHLTQACHLVSRVMDNPDKDSQPFPSPLFCQSFEPEIEFTTNVSVGATYRF
jgi:hypothetical protein